MSEEALKILIEKHKNNTLCEFLSKVRINQNDHLALFRLAGLNSDILERVFIFDYISKLPLWMLDRFGYDYDLERDIVEVNLSIIISQIFLF